MIEAANYDQPQPQKEPTVSRLHSSGNALVSAVNRLEELVEEIQGTQKEQPRGTDVSEVHSLASALSHTPPLMDGQAHRINELTKTLRDALL